MSDAIPLPDLPRALRDHGVITSYLQAWRLVTAGSIPAQRFGNRWAVRAADLPAIAEFVAQAGK